MPVSRYLVVWMNIVEAKKVYRHIRIYSQYSHKTSMYTNSLASLPTRLLLMQYMVVLLYFDWLLPGCDVL